MLVALVSEAFVESVQNAAETLGMTPAFVGFIVVALVLLSGPVGPAPMDLQFWPGAVVMRVHAIFAMTLDLLPPRTD